MLSIRNVTRAFGALQVLRGVSLTIEQGEIVCLLGPSGCGKTTLLRIVVGLETADGGDVLLDGQSIRSVPVHERDFGLMFQDFALFPHMNVAHNILFGLRMRHAPGEQAQQRLHDVLELVGLKGFERRDVTQLSGGERQRVALARSLAPSPRLLMLDEPLGSLDAALRERLVVELRDIIKRIGLTAIYVTHDQQEAFAIADRIAVMNAGRIEQVDAPPALYRQPKTTFVAGFLGLDNIVPVTGHIDGKLQTPLGEFEIPPHPGSLRSPPPLHDMERGSGGEVSLLLHPDGLQLTTSANGKQISGIIRELVFSGDMYRVELQHDSGIRLSFSIHSREIGGLKQGDRVRVSVFEDCIVPLWGQV
jgi:ABC-type Fe3+/spermidine/putrescine transport system ATPase subunit